MAAVNSAIEFGLEVVSNYQGVCKMKQAVQLKR